MMPGWGMGARPGVFGGGFAFDCAGVKWLPGGGGGRI